MQTLEPSVTRIRPLFPGTTCFPLSAPRKDKNRYEKMNQEFHAETHQLEKIFEIIGTPSKEDIDAMDEGTMKTFLLNLPKMEGERFEDLLPSASPDAIILLKRMLEFSKGRGRLMSRSQETDYCKRGVEVPFLR